MVAPILNYQQEVFNQKYDLYNHMVGNLLVSIWYELAIVTRIGYTKIAVFLKSDLKKEFLYLYFIYFLWFKSCPWIYLSNGYCSYNSYIWSVNPFKLVTTTNHLGIDDISLWYISFNINNQLVRFIAIDKQDF